MKANLKHLQLVLLISKHIEKKNTGTITDLARTLCIKENELSELLNFIKKELKAPVYYNSDLKTFCYDDAGEIVMRWMPKNK